MGRRILIAALASAALMALGFGALHEPRRDEGQVSPVASLAADSLRTLAGRASPKGTASPSAASVSNETRDGGDLSTTQSSAAQPAALPLERTPLRTGGASTEGAFTGTSEGGLKEGYAEVHEDPVAGVVAALDGDDLLDIQSAHFRLLEHLNGWPEAQRTAFDTYMDEPDSLIGDVFRAALANTLDPEMEMEIVSAVRTEQSHTAQLAALALLADAHALSRRTRTELMSTLSNVDDIEVRQAVLQALRRRGPVAVGESEAMARLLLPLTDQGDARSRALSIEVLSSWSYTRETQKVLTAALTTDESSIVRSAAVRSLLGHSNLEAETRHTLLDVVTNAAEDDEVRAGAWAVLEQYPMREPTASAYRAFMREQRLQSEDELLVALESGSQDLGVNPYCD